jgi:hypothetical protein
MNTTDTTTKPTIEQILQGTPFTYRGRARTCYEMGIASGEENVLVKIELLLVTGCQDAEFAAALAAMASDIRRARQDQ